MKTSELEGGLLDYWVAQALEAWKWADQFHPTMTLDSTFSGVEFGGFLAAFTG